MAKRCYLTFASLKANAFSVLIICLLTIIYCTLTQINILLYTSLGFHRSESIAFFHYVTSFVGLCLFSIFIINRKKLAHDVRYSSRLTQCKRTGKFSKHCLSHLVTDVPCRRFMFLVPCAVDYQKHKQGLL